MREGFCPKFSGLVPLFLLLLVTASATRAQVPLWEPDDAVLCEDMALLAMLDAGGGETIVLGQAGSYLMRVFRVESDGHAPSYDGALCGAPVSEGCSHLGYGPPALVPGALDGHWVIWSGSTDIEYRQRARMVDSGGRTVDPILPCGIELSTVPSISQPSAVPDGEGGFIAGFLEAETGRLFAQRMTSDGTRLWGEEGIVVASAGVYHTFQLVSDGAGGAIFAWCVEIDDFDSDLHAQRILPTGAVAEGWPAAGVEIAGGPGWQGTVWASTVRHLLGVPDGEGGAIFAFGDSRRDDGRDDGVARLDVAVARVAGDGALPWGDEGVLLTTDDADQFWIDLVSDGNAGAFVAWKDFRVPSTSEVRVQHVDALGTSLWGLEGVVVSDEGDGLWFPPSLAVDGAGGVYVGWREGPSYEQAMHRFLRLRSDGGVAPGWPPDGTALSGVGRLGSLLLSDDGSGGVIVARQDEDYDLRLQRFGPSGVAVPAPLSPSAGLVLRRTGTNPRGQPVRIQYALSKPSAVSIQIFDAAGRRVRDLSIPAQIQAGDHDRVWDLRDVTGRRVASGVYFLVLRAAGEVARQKLVVLR